MITRLAALGGLVAGIGALLLVGGELPAWLRTTQLALFSAAALAYGFSSFVPSPPWWLLNRYTRGVGFLYLGMASLFTPPQMVVCAVFMGVGIRHLMLPDPVTKAAPCTGLASRRAGTIVAEVES